jgi:hypothetical protein
MVGKPLNVTPPVSSANPEHPEPARNSYIDCRVYSSRRRISQASRRDGRRDVRLSGALTFVSNGGGGAAGIFTANQQGFGRGSIVKIDGVTVAQPGTPASIGETVVIYCTELGAVSPKVVEGVAPVEVPALDPRDTSLVSPKARRPGWVFGSDSLASRVVFTPAARPATRLVPVEGHVR